MLWSGKYHFNLRENILLYYILTFCPLVVAFCHNLQCWLKMYKTEYAILMYKTLFSGILPEIPWLLSYSFTCYNYLYLCLNTVTVLSVVHLDGYFLWTVICVISISKMFMLINILPLYFCCNNVNFSSVGLIQVFWFWCWNKCNGYRCF